MTYEFRPDWCLAPSATLMSWLEENGETQDSLAARFAGTDGAGPALVLICEVLYRKPLTPVHAELLARGTGIPARFWLARERDYREGLAAGLTDATAAPQQD